MQTTEQEQFPHFFGWLQQQQKTRRAMSASLRPLSAHKPTSSSTTRCPSAKPPHGSLNTHSTHSSRPSSHTTAQQQLQLQGRSSHLQQATLSVKPCAPPGRYSHTGTSSSSSCGKASRPASPQHGIPLKRPASAAPGMLLASTAAAHRPSTAAAANTHAHAAASRCARPCSAALPTSHSQQQQHPGLTHWQQQQALVSQARAQQCAGVAVKGHKPPLGSASSSQQQQQQPDSQPLDGSHTTKTSQQLCCAWLHSCAATIDQHQQQAQQQQQQQPSSLHTTATASPSSQFCCAGSSIIIPAWLKAQHAHPYTPVTAAATAVTAAAAAAAADSSLKATTGSMLNTHCPSQCTNGCSSSSSSAPKGCACCCCRCSTCDAATRPSSPLPTPASHCSWPSSPYSRMQPGSNASNCSSNCATRPASAAPAARCASPAANLTSPWGGLGCQGPQGPLMWQHLATPQPQQQPQLPQPPQPSEMPVQQPAGVPLQQPLCRHHLALQLFKQLPLRGAAAAAAVSRDGLQQLALGLSLALQEVGAPLELHPPLLQDALPTGSITANQGGNGVAAAAAAAAAADGCKEALGADAAPWSPADELAPELHVWALLGDELVRQTTLECSQRGQLLAATLTRSNSLLMSALGVAGQLHTALLQGAAGQQQQQEAMVAAQHEAGAIQQECDRLKAQVSALQAKLVATTVELQQQQERMRRGRFQLIHEQVAEARREIEGRVLRDLEAAVLRGVSQAREAAAAREERLLQAVAELAGPEVAAAVQGQLMEGGGGGGGAAVQQQQAVLSEQP